MADWLIEARAADLSRFDVLTGWDGLTLVERDSLTGAWQVTGPIGQLRPLLAAGTGAVISRGGDQVMSGPVTGLERRGDGTATVSGVSDHVRLADRVVYPTPAAEVWAQTADVYTATGARETLILNLINLNAGAGALAARRVAALRLPTTAGRGGTATITSRLDNLLTLAAQLAADGGLTIGVGQVEDGTGRHLDVTVRQTADLTATVRFGPPEEGGPGRLAADWSYAVAAPVVTRAIVAGSGTGVSRGFRERSAAAAETLWGRRVESVVDQRQTSNTAELDQAGDAALADGAGPTTVSATALDTPALGYRADWRVGDKVTVTLDGVDVANVVREVTTTVTVQSGQQTESVAPAVGTGDASKVTTPSQRALVGALRRLAALERRL